MKGLIPIKVCHTCYVFMPIACHYCFACGDITAAGHTALRRKELD